MTAAGRAQQAWARGRSAVRAGLARRRRAATPGSSGPAEAAAGPPPRPGEPWWTGTPWAAVVGSGLFDETHYRSLVPGRVPDDVDALWHYATHGTPVGLDPNPLLSSWWYRSTYPDVAASGLDPLVHYLLHGAAEARDPGPGFATAWYLRTYPDVAESGLNPLGHYLVVGAAEGRRPRPASAEARTGRGPSVVIVSGEPDTPGHRYRCERLAGAIVRLGGRARVVTVPEAAATHLPDIDAADLVVAWRAAWGDEVEAVVDRARKAGAVVAFDVDDLMIDPAVAVAEVVDGIRSQGLTEDEAQDWFAKMGRTAAAADVALTTTETIATELRRLGRPTWVVPNGVDDDTVVRSRLAARVRRSAPTDGLVRLGYAGGSRTHQRDLAGVIGPVADVLRSHPEARLVVFRHAVELDELVELDDLRHQVEVRDLVPHADLPGELARFDVNLAPLEVGNPFCEAKSDLKHFEAALVGVPTVASPTGPFLDAIDHGVTGFVPGDADGWRSSLDQLVVDADLRAEVGEAARRAVLWPTGELARTQVVGGLLDELVGSPPAAAAAFARARCRDGAARPPAPPLAERRIVVDHDHLRPSSVTVVVPVHDYADVVVEALESVRAQTLADLDLIVVDDASTDGSLEVVRDWLDRHHRRFGRAVLVAHAANAGVACARNAAFVLADTPHVLPLDADNVLLPTCAERLLGALGTSASAVAYPRIRHIGDSSELLEAGVVRGYLPYDAQRLVGSNWIDAMALVRVDAWAAAGGYRLGLGGWEDYDLWCRLAELGLPLEQVPEELALYRVHERSMLHGDTHADDDRLAAVHAAITAEHPWLHLVPDHPARPTAGPGAVAVGRHVGWDREAEGAAAIVAPVPSDRGDRLGERGRSLLEVLRCPETGEPLEEDPGGGLRSTVTGRRWPVVDGRPVLAADHEPVAFPADHVGNPLPDRARRLIAETDGWVLHLSGGGTRVGDDRVIEADLDLYEPTDVVADAHHVPLADASVDLVVACNAFEHYRRPEQVVAEIGRVLRPGGLVFVHTAFLQPVHEAPHHYANVTRWGLEAWFEGFDEVDLVVSDNFHPGFSLAWLASDLEQAVADELGPDPAALLADMALGRAAAWWRDPGTRAGDERWAALARLSQEAQSRLAAGFEYVGRRP